MAEDIVLDEPKEIEVKQENRVTDSDLNVLREQIKRKDEENAALAKSLEAERTRAQTATSRVGDEIGNRFVAETVAVENTILAATSEIDTLEKQQAALQEEGKFGEATKLNRLIAAAALKLEKAEDSKRTLEANKTRLQAEIEAQKNDPLAVYSPAARNWINAHPKFLSDAAYKNKAMAAHYQAQAEGIKLDSPEYFNKLTEAVEPKITVQTQEDDVDDEPPKEQRRTVAKSSTALPVSRETPRGKSGGSGRIQLTPDEAEAAIISRPDLPKEEAYRRYFANKQRAIADGKLGKSA